MTEASRTTLTGSGSVFARLCIGGRRGGSFAPGLRGNRGFLAGGSCPSARNLFSPTVKETGSF
jgi:hypothetical protein